MNYIGVDYHKRYSNITVVDLQCSVSGKSSMEI
jgi:hypothetical protein